MRADLKTADTPLAGARVLALPPPPRAASDPWYVRWALTGLTLGIVGVLVVVPLVNVFSQALAKGLGAYWGFLVDDPDTRHAVFLTLVVAPVAVALNVVF